MRGKGDMHGGMCGGDGGCGACVAGDTATVEDGKHPNRMHSCSVSFQCRAFYIA